MIVQLIANINSTSLRSVILHAQSKSATGFLQRFPWLTTQPSSLLQPDQSTITSPPFYIYSNHPPLHREAHLSPTPVRSSLRLSSRSLSLFDGPKKGPSCVARTSERELLESQHSKTNASIHGRPAALRHNSTLQASWKSSGRDRSCYER